MAAYMVVYLNLSDPSWVPDYIQNVPAILRSYGGEYVAVSGPIKRLEGDMPVPTQIAIFSFPSQEAIEKFMADPRYKPYKDARIKGSSANVFMFDNAH